MTPSMETAAVSVQRVGTMQIVTTVHQGIGEKDAASAHVHLLMLSAMMASLAPVSAYVMPDGKVLIVPDNNRTL